MMMLKISTLAASVGAMQSPIGATPKGRTLTAEQEAMDELDWGCEFEFFRDSQKVYCETFVRTGSRNKCQKHRFWYGHYSQRDGTLCKGTGYNVVNRDDGSQFHEAFSDDAKEYARWRFICNSCNDSHDGFCCAEEKLKGLELEACVKKLLDPKSRADGVKELVKHPELTIETFYYIYAELKISLPFPRVSFQTEIAKLIEWRISNEAIATRESLSDTFETLLTNRDINDEDAREMMTVVSEIEKTANIILTPAELKFMQARWPALDLGGHKCAECKEPYPVVGQQAVCNECWDETLGWLLNAKYTEEEDCPIMEPNLGTLRAMEPNLPRVTRRRWFALDQKDDTEMKLRKAVTRISRGNYVHGPLGPLDEDEFQSRVQSFISFGKRQKRLESVLNCFQELIDSDRAQVQRLENLGWTKMMREAKESYIMEKLTGNIKAKVMALRYAKEIGFAFDQSYFMNHHDHDKSMFTFHPQEILAAARIALTTAELDRLFEHWPDVYLSGKKVEHKLNLKVIPGYKPRPGDKR